METKVMTNFKKRNGRIPLLVKLSAFLTCFVLLVLTSAPLYAADDEKPFFVDGVRRAPNIMFVFDNSDSMQDMPNLRADGRTVRPGTEPNSSNNTESEDWLWRLGVALNTDGTIQENNGSVVWDYDAYPSDVENAIPQQAAPDLPGNMYDGGSGIDPLTGEVDVNDPVTPQVLPQQIPLNLPPLDVTLSGIVTDSTNSQRIYDNNLDWSTVGNVLNDDSTFETNYRYRRVKIEHVGPSAPAEADQFKTIRSRSTGSEYFRVYHALPDEITGSISYTVGENYTYTILADTPGQVTRTRSEKNRVVDANVDWIQVESDWSDKWDHYILTVTAGTNVGESRIINNYSVGSKYWKVSSDFTAPCDTTTKYEITAYESDPLRIYDRDLDWQTADTVLTNETKFNKSYRYRIINVRSKVGGVEQKRTLMSTEDNEYFSYDSSVNGGGPLVYDPVELSDPDGGYTYTIEDGAPGSVTYYRSNTHYMTDANVDWDDVNSNFSATWENKTLVVTEGTNKGETGRIYNIDVDGKLWKITPDFPEECDSTTKYKIIGSPDDNRYAIGGNHPGSKLYQAKQAVNIFLESPKIKQCVPSEADCQSEIYSFNIGFATYLSARVPRVTAKYYRKVPDQSYQPNPRPKRYCARYKYFYNTWGSFTHPTSDSTFTAGSDWVTAGRGVTDDWVTNREHTDVDVDYQFDRLYLKDHCREQIIQYTVYAIDSTPGPDGTLPNQKTFRVRSRVSDTSEGGAWSYHGRCYNEAIPGMTSHADLPAVRPDGETLIPSGQPCHYFYTYAANPNPPYVSRPAYYQVEYRDTSGNYNISDNSLPKYVDTATNMVTPYEAYSGNGWSPRRFTETDPENGDYTLVTSTLSGKEINRSNPQGTGDIEPNKFDTSYFMYPGYGTDERPHGWSYKKSTESWLYGDSDWWGNAYYPHEWAAGYNSSMPGDTWPGGAAWAWSEWGGTPALAPTYPAVIGGEMSNTSGDDQVIFVNLPEYDETKPKDGDDVDGNNVAQILEYVDLARVNNPKQPDDWQNDTWTPRFDYTTMPYSHSLAPNAYSAKWLSGTPIAASLTDLATYYKGYIAQDAATLGQCRSNNVIFMTDGLESGGGQPADAAAALLTLDVGGKDYAVETYVVGFGLDDTSKAALNDIAHAGDPEGGITGGRDAYFATNVSELANILVEDITAELQAGSYSRSAPVITQFASGSDLQLYSAYFDYPSWRGHLNAYNIDPGDGSITGPATGWTGDCDGDTFSDADAGCIMTTAVSRTVYSSFELADVVPADPDNLYERVSFVPSNPTSRTDLKDDLLGGGATDGDVEIAMNYILDAGYDSAAYKGTRDVDWPLGDIYHSIPVVVGAPFYTPPTSAASDEADPYFGYDEFKTDHIGREGRLYVGANDGMVHGFKTSDGSESWAYIPNAVLAKLSEIEQGHRFTVDLSMKAADIYSPGGADTIWSPVVITGTDTIAEKAEDKKAGWHTLLVSGLRDGGSSYFALDVTNASNPQIAWEMTDDDGLGIDMGFTWSTPSFGRLLINGVYTHVVIVGGGLSSLNPVYNDVGNSIYILDAGTGKVLSNIPVGGIQNKVPSEILVLEDKDKNSSNYGNITEAYFGDTSGDLWKITDLNAVASWSPSVTLLHDGEGKVFYRPAITKSHGACEVTIAGETYQIQSNTTFIMYGTGDEENPGVKGSQDRMYAIAYPPLIGVSAGADATLTKVWERDFDPSEKMLSAPIVHLNTIYFVTYSAVGGCGAGESFLWGLTLPRCGDPGNEPGLIYDTDGGSDGGPWDKFSVGHGISSGFTSAGPVGYLQPPGGGPPLPIPLPDANRLEYWREKL